MPSSALSALGVVWPSVMLHRLFSAHTASDAPSNFMLCSDDGASQDWMTVGDLGGLVRLELPAGTSFWAGDAIRGTVHVEAVKRPLRRVQVKLLEQEQRAKQPNLVRVATVWERSSPDGTRPVDLLAVPFALSLAPMRGAASICPSVPRSTRDWRGAAHLLRLVVEPCAVADSSEPWRTTVGSAAFSGCGPAEAEEAWNTLNVTIAPHASGLESAWHYPALSWACRHLSRPLLRTADWLWGAGDVG